MADSAQAPYAARWPRYQHVFFDCDSTLSRVEGIDELAGQETARERVKRLTSEAMDGARPLRDVYGERLELLSPTRAAVRALKSRYRKNVVEDAVDVIAALHALGHAVYIVSGGLLDPVKEFGMSIGVRADKIRAVELQFDALSGEWWHAVGGPWQERYLAYRQSELAESDGKARVIRELRAEQAGRALLVGDGVSDLLASPAVDLFVGYGGVVRRDRVASEAPIFIDCESLAPVLLLAAGTAALRSTDQRVKAVVENAVEALRRGAVLFTDAGLRRKFTSGLSLTPTASG